MKVFLKIFAVISFLFLSLAVNAQGKPAATMADLMRSDGRIYVVIAVILTILAGIVLYVTRLDRRVTKLEKEN